MGVFFNFVSWLLYKNVDVVDRFFNIIDEKKKRERLL